MADIKISELPVAEQANADDLLEASQTSGAGYVTRQITLDDVTNLVVASDQLETEIDAAIAEIPPPPPSDWGSITGKPATFPPTVPIAYTNISGTPTSLPPSGAAGGDLSGTYPNPTAVKASGAFAVTGALTGTSATFSGTVGVGGAVGSAKFRSNGADADLLGLFSGTTKGVRFVSSATEIAIQGVDNTGVASYQPLTLHGSIINTTAPLKVLSTTAIPAGGTLGAGTLFSSTANFGINFGSGAPDKAMATGSLYLRSDGGGIPYYNTNGTTGGWVAVSNTVLQTVSTQTGAVATGTTIIPYDDTIPQITEGNEYMTLAITPRSATSKLVIDVIWNGASSSAAAQMAVALFQDSTANALAATGFTYNGANCAMNISLRHTMTSGTTSATTFRVRAGANIAGTTTFNGLTSARIFGGVMASSIVIQEVAP